MEVRVRKAAVIVATVLAAAAGGLAPASAITGNYTPDDQHDYVGLVFFYDAAGNPAQVCSGSLLSPTVFLTAGHCTAGFSSARVYFAQDAGGAYDPELGIDPVTGFPFTCLPQPDPCVTSSQMYNYGFTTLGPADSQDVGVVILDQPVYLETYASLAAAGSLDRLATRRGHQDATFTVSGYGVSRINPVGAEAFYQRLMATTQLVNLESAKTAGYNIQLSSAPGGGSGGTCFGDSGGPVLYGSTDIVVAVSSFVTRNCRGVNYAYRTDQVAVIAWILALAGDEADQISVVEI
jgi:hypothetical protein